MAMILAKYRDLPFSYPRITLLIIFILWKALLLSIACLSPTSYDSSTEILFGHDSSIPLVVRKLTRWDAIYFMHIAERGYVYEQEWAFGWLHTRGLSFLGNGGSSFPAENVYVEVLNRGRSHLPVPFLAKNHSNILSGDRILAFDTPIGRVDTL